MTDQELAHQLFSQPIKGSNASASLLTGTALEASSNGQVLVMVDGAIGGSVDAGILLPTMLSVAAGENIIITLYGQEGRGKKAIVSGRVGETPGGDPTLPGRVATLENQMTSVQNDITTLDTSVTNQGGRITTLEGTVTSQGNRITTLEGQWGYWDIGTFSSNTQIVGPGVYKFGNIGGAVQTKWSGSNVGDYRAICWDFNGSSSGAVFATIIVTSPRANTIWEVNIWSSAIDYVRAI